ncbi:MAG: type III pantothenate kinase [Desulfovibrio sp.]|jgi:type III pantothenate kinase|nr:type III pantothenate kinase [Desulfovibrio sp.]
MPTVIFFDIGNTNIKIGIGTKEKINFSFVLPSDERRTADEFGISLLALLTHCGIDPQSVHGAIGTSVVPAVSRLVSEACLRFVRKKVLFAPEEVSIPLENHYSRPHEVGADRLVGAYAARRLFQDAPSLITVDYGTATTFDCVEDNAYLGGLICPGLLSSSSALSAGTAKLQRISLEIEDERPVMGRSTASSMNNGFVFGFASMTEGLCARLSETLRQPTVVVATGGFAQALSRVTRRFDAVLPDLLLEGLRLLYKEQVKE